ncbi:MAG: sulfotransferase [Desulforhopalus sp.]
MIENQLLYIAGSGRSGSTLLDMLLSRHTGIAALGEVHRLYMNLRNHTDSHKCTCGKFVQDCLYWEGVDKCLKEMGEENYVKGLSSLITTDPQNLNILDDETGKNILEAVPRNIYGLKFSHILLLLGSKRLFNLFSDLFPSINLVNRIANDSHVLYDAVRKATGKQIVVDSTKTPMRLKSLYLLRPSQFKVIYLVRDGRAVSFARMRRQGISMTHAAKIWKSEQVKLKAILFTIPKEKVLSIRYEDLCTDTENQLRRVCGFLGIDFEECMAKFDKEKSHSLGGNPMRWRREERKIVLNNTWYNDISQSQLEDFEKVAGHINTRFGYDKNI